VEKTKTEGVLQREESGGLTGKGRGYQKGESKKVKIIEKRKIINLQPKEKNSLKKPGLAVDQVNEKVSKKEKEKSEGEATGRETEL